MLAGKKILIAVCGSIAAYKTAFFIRLLVKNGAEVRVLMTESAKDFISPLTLSTLSKNPVHSTFIKDEAGQWTNHVEMGLWADLMIIAPLSANTLGKMAHGICDNILLATYLSARCPVMIAPAMDLDMYQHPTTQENLRKVQTFGNILLEAHSGELASGLVGVGRMQEPEALLDSIIEFFSGSKKLKDKKILITSGPTHESIDPVRFIGNHSTGKMGKEIALEFAKRGAVVEFISGPAQHLPEHPNINTYLIGSADELYEKAKKIFPTVSISIFAAAVADYKPEKVLPSKIKKEDKSLEIKLIPNPDIALELGKIKSKDQINVGFALETDQEESNAKSKLKKKNFDMIVLNSLQHKGAGFAHDTNQVTIYTNDNKTVNFELKSKHQVAIDLVDMIESKLS